MVYLRHTAYNLLLFEHSQFGQFFFIETPKSMVLMKQNRFAKRTISLNTAPFWILRRDCKEPRVHVGYK